MNSQCSNPYPQPVQNVIKETKTREKISEKTMEVSVGAVGTSSQGVRTIKEPLEESHTPLNICVLPIIFL